MQNKIKYVLSVSVILIILVFTCYRGFERLLEWVVLKEARNLVELERKNGLSREYGYVWSEINLAGKMASVNRELARKEADTLSTEPGHVADTSMPSLAAIAELNRIREVSNRILITDRHGYPLAEIKTTHTLLKLDEFNPVLVQAIIRSEDVNFATRELAYEYRAFVRAALKSIRHGAATLSFPRPRGTSTIHQQVAKFLLLRFDARGNVYAERTLSRKIRELKLAQALKMYYSRDDLLQVYLNHCVNAGHGMTGFHDISLGLFGKKPAELDICQSLYLARLVKWNRNLPAKITAQIRVDMPRLAPALGWDARARDSILTALDNLTFLKPRRIVSDHNPLVDLANETWLMVCRKNGMPPEEAAEMDFSQSGSMIRRKGNLEIRLAVDLRLQKKLEQLVNARGFGRDTLLHTDVRVGSFGADVRPAGPVRDTLRRITVLRADTLFREPGSRFVAKLGKGDTLVTNIRYRRLGPGEYRRSLFFYARDTLRAAGQYFAYAMMDSRTGELLAYYSRDGIGSRLSALLRNRTPNGSSVAKPILYALNYDLGHLKPFEMESDSVEAAPPCPWARRFLLEKGARTGMVYLNTSAPGGYPVSNHGKTFEGYDYIFNHLTESNNILCVEMIYRLDSAGTTGAQLYAGIASLAGAPADSVADRGGRVPMPADNYSVALGTLELSLYEQMHLFNVIYGNRIIVNPKEHPSLVVKFVSIAGEPVAFTDSLDVRPLFRDLENIRPVHLGLHQRLVSNPMDDLARYDVPMDSLSGLLSNLAKSGTTDDIIRPYNRDIATKERANYGLWNAVLRLNVPKSEYPNADTAKGDSIPDLEMMDVTLACVGECNERNTGARDGKSLHKYVSAGFLHAWGVPTDTGFFKTYAGKIARETPDSVLYLNPYESPALDSELAWEIREKVGEDSGAPTLGVERRMFYGYGLKKGSYERLLSFTLYLGGHAGEFYALLEKLDDTRSLAAMASIVGRMRALKPSGNRYFAAAYDGALADLAGGISASMR